MGTQAHDEKIVAAIREHWAQEGTAPTLEQIAAAIGYPEPVKAKSAVFYTCEKLTKAGKLEEVWVKFGERRAYKVVEEEE